MPFIVSRKTKCCPAIAISVSQAAIRLSVFELLPRNEKAKVNVIKQTITSKWVIVKHCKHPSVGNALFSTTIKSQAQTRPRELTTNIDSDTWEVENARVCLQNLNLLSMFLNLSRCHK